MGRDETPLKSVVILPKLKQYAEEHGLIIDFHYAKKIKWMEAHGGVCFCAHKSDRRCPCSHVQSDLERYNGSCLCSVLKTPECYARVLKRRNRPLLIRLPCNIIMKNGIISEAKQKKNNGEKIKKDKILWKNLIKKK